MKHERLVTFLGTNPECCLGFRIGVVISGDKEEHQCAWCGHDCVKPELSDDPYNDFTEA
jgi:hypothetical protein